MIGFVLVFGNLLHPREMALLAGTGTALLGLFWNVGIFTIYSKLTGAKGVGIELEAAAQRRVGRRRRRKASAL